MNREDLLHIIEEGTAARFAFRTADGEVLERPRRIDVRWSDGDPATCTIVMDGTRHIRPLDAIVSIEPAP